MRRTLFWGSVGLIIYTYLIYPVIVFFRGIFSAKPYKTADITPKVSMIIAAYNEANSIGAKLDNVLALDYPREQLEVLVASDGSNDGTNEIVARYAQHGIRLLALPRAGKAPALNAAVKESTGEILVFSDANSMYREDAIRGLVRPFADPEVGGVAGNQTYRKNGASSSGDGERGYWNFDQFLKKAQSRAGNAISATGAIYAIRRSLFMTVPDGVTDDFVTSTRVIAQGFRLVYAPDAVAYEAVAKSGKAEFGRKVRVMTRGLNSVLTMRELLNPFRYGFYSFQIFSHKVLRRLVAFPLLLLFVVSPLLWPLGIIYQLATLGQVAFYGLGAVGWLFSEKRFANSKLFTIPFFFIMVNYSAMLATINVIRGRRIDRWETQRQD
ncbi:MAG: glycosyltransferase family 2 protein [Anaerolineales bacterium]|nr:glycosyltransferase family 2 protein [Anaerolineales bacterium]